MAKPTSGLIVRPEVSSSRWRCLRARVMTKVFMLFQYELQIFLLPNPLTLQRRPESGISQLLDEEFAVSIAQLLG
jgi:hypothetical protein